MERIAIVCIDDEREVLDALVRDLEDFASHFRIEPCESAADAGQVIEDLIREGWTPGLVLADHLMPGTSGVDFLIALNSRPETRAARKILVTAQAGLEDTVRAVNRADLDYYIRKPWKKSELHEVVRRFLTDFVLENSSDPLAFVPVLDAPRLFEGFRDRGAPAPS